MIQNAARWRAPYLFIPLLAMALAGCAADDYLGKPKEPEPNIFPADYKKEVLGTIVPLLEYPNNVRDALISDPVLVPVNKDQRYAVCVRANSRNERGQYAGPKDRIAYFFAGHLNQLILATTEQCGNAAYKPFAELATYCAGEGCVGKR
ncbi:MAG TPA: hypothetical protein VFC54_01870 [Pseudolabrys sp.]|nr:hypothetical protein [Pseudolabrys sp.]